MSVEVIEHSWFLASDVADRYGARPAVAGRWYLLTDTISGTSRWDWPKVAPPAAPPCRVAHDTDDGGQYRARGSRTRRGHVFTLRFGNLSGGTVEWRRDELLGKTPGSGRLDLAGRKSPRFLMSRPDAERPDGRAQPDPARAGRGTKRGREPAGGPPGWPDGRGERAGQPFGRPCRARVPSDEERVGRHAGPPVGQWGGHVRDGRATAGW